MAAMPASLSSVTSVPSALVIEPPSCIARMVQGKAVASPPAVEMVMLKAPVSCLIFLAVSMNSSQVQSSGIVTPAEFKRSSR